METTTRRASCRDEEDMKNNAAKMIEEVSSEQMPGKVEDNGCIQTDHQQQLGSDGSSSSNNNPTTVPSSSTFETIPIFHPTLADMQDFDGYLSRLASQGIAEIGVCKIIPPQDWKWNPDLIKAKTLIVHNPIQQCVTGRAGMYSVCNVVRKDLTVEAYEAKARKVELRNLNALVPEEIERRFWKSLTTTAEAPLYGSDVLGTLFGDTDIPFNTNRLDCMLKRVGVDLPGITRPMMYVGQWRSFFPFHTEDMYMFSMSFLHHGAPKHWYGVRPSAMHRLESLARGAWPEERCPEFMRHKTKMISPTRLAQGGIPFVRAIQKPGEIMMTWPGAYHAGFNSGFNIAEAVNFVPPSLYMNFLEMAKKAGVCQCRPDSVRLDVNWLASVVEGGNSSNVLANVSGARCMASCYSGARNMVGSMDGNSPARKRARRVAGAPVLNLTVGAMIEWRNDVASTVVDGPKWEKRKIVANIDGHVRLHLINTHQDKDVWVSSDSDSLRAVTVVEMSKPPIHPEQQQASVETTTQPVIIIQQQQVSAAETSVCL